MQRTHARAGAIGVCDVPSTHPCHLLSTLTCGGAHTGGAHARAHIPGAQIPGRAAGYIAIARRNRLGDPMLEGMLVAKCNRDLLD
jgi:hypothetical protein